ncbi:phytanoyl-CoA dioxygenase family protein [Mycolicibacterium sp. 120266]|uniref:phytanoyl-CoA dioxygenase family protein n=1 Tax=Mycolicibacterium sp. 120266 TaxID=3090601 RepID=UPI00299E49A2|nr:phytanoyl-CoA dioxygenase family protein [Mycolicibacterium sp. 120266]MDX1875290.1 phytanoyl-CoA dioxygenase family protein [Mycolicibacterium sp. 120266]
MPELNHLPATAHPEQITRALREDGYVIIDNLVPASHMDRVAEELSPYIEGTAYGADDFLGVKTRRTGSLIARSVAARELVAHPTVLSVAGDYLSHASKFQLHLTQVISIGPGSPAQAIHRDELAWDFFPFPADYQVQCNTLWAMSDYTAEMGATRVVPGSHLLGTNEKFSQEDSLPAEMERGSVLLYNGKIYHGGGANTTTDKVRQAINITYAVGWVRQEENQYLSTPMEIARTLDDDLLKLMGYQLGCFAIGYVGDVADPLSVVRDDVTGHLSIEDMKSAADRQDSANTLMNAITDTSGARV